MKTLLFLKFFFCAFAFLFIFQGIWLYYAYQNKKIEVEKTLNIIFQNAVEQEMRLRFIQMNEILTDEVLQIDALNSNIFEVELDYNERIYSQQYNFMQQILSHERINLDISALDSIFSSYLADENLPLHYQILCTDSLDNIEERIGADIDRGFQTDRIPIVDKFDVHAIIKISLPVIFKNMLVILLASICIFILITACLIYLINVFLTQHHLNQLRESFANSLTHEMKTPLGTIFTVLDQIKKGTIDDNPEMKNQFIQIGIEQTMNLQAIVNQILVVAYIEKKQLSLNKELVDLSQVIKPLISKFIVKGGKEIVFTEEYQLNDTPIFVDQLYFSNAISNLIDNAIKYSGDSVKINIICTVNNKQLYIRVIDNGFGISEKDQLKIFEQFERGAEIKRNKISGFGLGLNYAKAVIKAHGGAISVCSRSGEGSEFIITIPVPDN